MESILSFLSFLLIELPARVIAAYPGGEWIAFGLVVLVVILLLLMRRGRKKR